MGLSYMFFIRRGVRGINVRVEMPRFRAHGCAQTGSKIKCWRSFSLMSCPDWQANRQRDASALHSEKGEFNAYAN